MSRVSIHQSQYIPWPPYFQKMASADIFVVLDTVQFQKNGVQNRNKIRSKEGDFWLTIPVTGHLGDPISNKRIADREWNIKHWKSIQNAYARAPLWGACSKELEFLYAGSYSTLGEVNKALLDYMIGYLKIKTKVLYLSDVNASGSKSGLILNICKQVGATVYVSGPGGVGYLKEEDFSGSGIRIEYFESIPPVYPQFNGKDFISGLSMIDMMVNADAVHIGTYLHAYGARTGDGLKPIDVKLLS